MTQQTDYQLILTANPDFVDLAMSELSKSSADIQDIIDLAPGIFLVTLGQEYWDLAEEWRLSPPIFIRHICPVQVSLAMNGTTTDLDQLSTSVMTEMIPLIEPELPFSVQTRILEKSTFSFKPFDVNNRLADLIREKTETPLDVRNPAQILSVVCASDTQRSAYIGLSPTIYNLSDWAGGMRRFAREPEQVSRSEFKLLEALEIFKIHLPARGLALDLGAAPGGWTRVLRQREQYVTAIDPGELDSRIKADRQVRHLRMTAEAYLEDEPDRYDMIVNDMRIDARDSARLMAAFARHLYADGFGLITLKLPEQRREPVLDHAFNILRKAYVIVGARQLFHNRSEITVYLKPRS